MRMHDAKRAAAAAGLHVWFDREAKTWIIGTPCSEPRRRLTSQDFGRLNNDEFLRLCRATKEGTTNVQ